MSPENEEKTEWVDDELVKVKLLYPFGVSVKVDLDTLNELDLIAMFDRKKLKRIVQLVPVDMVNSPSAITYRRRQLTKETNLRLRFRNATSLSSTRRAKHIISLLALHVGGI